MSRLVKRRYVMGARQLASHGIDAEDVCNNHRSEAVNMTDS